MKKLIIIIISLLALNCYSQELEPINVKVKGEAMTLHPKSATGINKEKVIVDGSTYDGFVYAKAIDVEYEFPSAMEVARENRDKMKEFAITYLTGIGLGIAGGTTTYFGARNNNQEVVIGGCVMCSAGLLACILSFVPLIQDNLYISDTGIGVRIKIKSNKGIKYKYN